MHESRDKCQAFVDEHPDYDFFISSIHVVDMLDPYYPEYFSDKTEKEGYLRYFETILENVKEYDGYNVYGHLDYILRCGSNKAKYFDIKDYYDVFYEILKTILPSAFRSLYDLCRHQSSDIQPSGVRGTGTHMAAVQPRVHRFCRIGIGCC